MTNSSPLLFTSYILFRNSWHVDLQPGAFQGERIWDLVMAVAWEGIFS